jgi:hypothetical protein
VHHLDCPGEDELECHCGEYYVEIVDTLTSVDGMNRGKVKLHNNDCITKGVCECTRTFSIKFPLELSSHCYLT